MMPVALEGMKNRGAIRRYMPEQITVMARIPNPSRARRITS